MYHTYIIASCTKQAANRSVDQQGEGAYAWLTRVSVTSQKKASGCWPPKESLPVIMQYPPQCFIPRHWNKCYNQHAMMGFSQHTEGHNVNEAETRVLCFSSSKTLTSSSVLFWSLKGDNLIKFYRTLNEVQIELLCQRHQGIVKDWTGTKYVPTHAHIHNVKNKKKMAFMAEHC